MAGGIKAKPALRDLQRALGKNNSEMAKLVKCSRKTWESAISGGRVSPIFMAKVTDVFDCTLDTYFETTRDEKAA